MRHLWRCRMPRIRLLVLLSSILIATTCATAMTIAENGSARAVIVVDPNASVSDRHAANELAAFLGQVTGASFQITNDPAADKPQILIGEAAARLADPAFSVKVLGNEGIIIRTRRNDLILAGGEPRGSLYAVYTFLEDEVGCHWWTPSASTIPSRPNLVIRDLDEQFVPPFEYRETDDPGTWTATGLREISSMGRIINLRRRRVESILISVSSSGITPGHSGR